jgi:asparagine synthase (glutamine-hydrolysing)
VDREVASAAMAVDDTLKLRGGLSKPLLVSLARALLPGVDWARPKQGFVLPFEPWLRGPLRAEVDAGLTGERLARIGIRERPTRALWQEFLSGRGGGWTRPWVLYTLVRWAERNDLHLDDARPATRGVGVAG